MSCWWLIEIALGKPINVFGTMAAAIGGLLPDLDHPESVLGRRLSFVSQPLARACGHRGFTHSLLGLLGLLAIVVLVSGLFAAIATSETNLASRVASEPFAALYGPIFWLLLPLIVGYLSHLLGDALTPSGVPLFWPYQQNYSLNWFKAFSWQETACVAAFTFAVVLLGNVHGQVWHNFRDQTGMF